MKIYRNAFGGFVALMLVSGAFLAYKSPVAVQRGAPGVAMQVVDAKKNLAAKVAANQVPPSLPQASPGGKLAVDAYQNVQVLGHITSGDFTRLMTAMTLWVAPQQGCAYCHAHQKDANGKEILGSDGQPLADLANMHSDELYTKRVARRMLQMTMHINADWQPHVAQTGVTCWTCHRGNPVPKNIWFDTPDSPTDSRLLGGKFGQNQPSIVAGYASLPVDPLTPFLADTQNIRVQSQAALDSGNRRSIKETEWTYALMTHMSLSLGVNCTYCHNSRSWSDWSQSPMARTTAWYGIRMVRDLNGHFLEPLKPTFPDHRLGPSGDSPKLNCATCHQGAYKPLLGTSMLKDYSVLASWVAQPAKTPEPPPAPSSEPPAAPPSAPSASAAPSTSASAMAAPSMSASAATSAASAASTAPKASASVVK